MIEKGYYEINIVAQDLGAWGSDLYGEGDHFTSLMKELASLDGDFVLRMLYIHPDTFPVDLIQAVKENSRILPYFDIPFQHSWPRVLRGMKRSGRGQRDLCRPCPEDKGGYAGCRDQDNPHARFPR